MTLLHVTDKMKQGSECYDCHPKILAVVVDNKVAKILVFEIGVPGKGRESIHAMKNVYLPLMCTSADCIPFGTCIVLT